MKTAAKFHLYVLDAEMPVALAAMGLETESLPEPALVQQPALILLRPGQRAPDQVDASTLEVPPDASPGAVRELMRVAMENVRSEERRVGKEIRTWWTSEGVSI